MEHIAWSLTPTRHNGGCRSGVGLVDSRIGLSLTWHALLARHLRTKQTYYSIFHTVDLALESTTESLQGRRFLTQAMLRIVEERKSRNAKTLFSPVRTSIQWISTDYWLIPLLSSLSPEPKNNNAAIRVQSYPAIFTPST